MPVAGVGRSQAGSSAGMCNCSMYPLMSTNQACNIDDTSQFGLR